MSLIPDVRPYQQQGIEFLVTKRRALLADDVGLGKTYSILKAIQDLQGYPTLVICIKPALYTWQNELMKWFNLPSSVYTGKPHERAEIWKQFKKEQVPVLITNYAFAGEIFRRKATWGTLVCDEIEKGGLLNHRSKTHASILKLAKRSDNLFLATATPYRATPADLYAPLQLIDPEEFTSYWRFVHTHCVVIKDQFGNSIERRPANPAGFRQFLRYYMIRRLKQQVMPELPPLIRQPITVDMTSGQRLLYKEMEKEMLVDLQKYGEVLDPSKDLSYAQNEAVKIMRLRQLLVTPKLLGVDITGGILSALPELIESEFDSGSPVVIFTPFRKAVPFIKESVLTLDPVETYEIYGQMTDRALAGAHTQFQSSSKTRRVCICVIKSAASFELYKSSSCFFLGYEWAPGENIQAEGRLHRSGQRKSVHSYYMLHKDTVDDLVRETLNSKSQGELCTITRQDVLDSISSRVS